jgi:hypothetical protein
MKYDLTADDLEEADRQTQVAEAHARAGTKGGLTEALLRAARPTEVYRCQVGKGHNTVLLEPHTTNYAWMDKQYIQREGFDPDAYNGPTYWRIAFDPTDGRYYYCSTFRRPGGPTVLLMTDVSKQETV